jgi:hypothetical protein
MTRESWRDWARFVLNGNTIYCSVTFANRSESTKFITFLETKLNEKTSSRRLKPDSCQTRQHKTDRLTPDSRQTQTPPDPTIGSTIASFAFLPTRVATVGTSFQFFPHRTNGALVQSSVTNTGLYIGSRYACISLESHQVHLVPMLMHGGMPSLLHTS